MGHFFCKFGNLSRQPIAVSDISIYIFVWLIIRSKSKEQLNERQAGLSKLVIPVNFIFANCCLLFQTGGQDNEGVQVGRLAQVGRVVQVPRWSIRSRKSRWPRWSGWSGGQGVKPEGRIRNNVLLSNHLQQTSSCRSWWTSATQSTPNSTWASMESLTARWLSKCTRGRA